MYQSYVQQIKQSVMESACNLYHVWPIRQPALRHQLRLFQLVKCGHSPPSRTDGRITSGRRTGDETDFESLH